MMSLVPVQLKTASVFARRMEESSRRRQQAARIKARSLSGRWHKDHSRSDSMQETADLFELTFVARRGAALANNVKIDDTETEFSTHVKALVITINETYSKSGESCQYPRRDLRRGKIEGRFERSKDGHPCIRVTWGEPFTGECIDQYELSEDQQEITQTSTYTRQSNGQTTVFRTMWTRA